MAFVGDSGPVGEISGRSNTWRLLTRLHFFFIIRYRFTPCREEAIGFRLLNRERTLMNMYSKDTEDV